MLGRRTQLNTGFRGTLLQDVVGTFDLTITNDDEMMIIISATWTPGHLKVLAASADALISSCVARRCVLLQHMPHAIWTLVFFPRLFERSDSFFGFRFPTE